MTAAADLCPSLRDRAVAVTGNGRIVRRRDAFRLDTGDQSGSGPLFGPP